MNNFTKVFKKKKKKMIIQHKQIDKLNSYFNKIKNLF